MLLEFLLVRMKQAICYSITPNPGKQLCSGPSEIFPLIREKLLDAKHSPVKNPAIGTVSLHFLTSNPKARTF